MLRGERVLLRPVRRDDLPRIYLFTNDPTFKTLIGDVPFTPQSLERLTAQYETQWREGGRDGPRFAIEADNTYIGHVFLYDIAEAARVGWLSIGIGDPDYQGKGYGRDVIALMLDYAFRLHHLRKVCLSVNAANERAVRCYRACGFVEEGRQRQQVWIGYGYDDLLLMGILREEWQSEPQQTQP